MLNGINSKICPGVFKYSNSARVFLKHQKKALKEILYSYLVPFNMESNKQLPFLSNAWGGLEVAVLHIELAIVKKSHPILSSLIRISSSIIF